MGKPAPSFQNNSIGLSLAQTACKSTTSKLDLVARSGRFAIFQAVKEIFPPCIRDEVTSRDGITEVQLNKALQKAGFKRVRDRRALAIKRSEDPTGAGMYLFSNLRWRDPSDAEDRADLISGWNALTERFPKVAQVCSLEGFLAIVGRFYQQWQPNAERASMRASFELEADSSDDGNSAAQTPRNAEAATAVQLSPLLLNQEILNLQLELATAKTIALLQSRNLSSAVQSSLPPTSGGTSCLVPQLNLNPTLPLTSNGFLHPSCMVLLGSTPSAHQQQLGHEVSFPSIGMPLVGNAAAFELAELQRSRLYCK
eukprot:CAMPEP_0202808848 /NCGR_PEP_ID=MMETSP1389-20130828/1288_1 /ASSEMBLY_ACC=CAM_ASM_000865 /TAXON_ID=302021 /ORGANISM="Rhodomonas sp., Strain CCMP768" /LENGTH=311 /DNA_ID=CAMNT_0049479273 /DNA_START=37 /DNA_END=973 /DNA_ORIENTATION=-